MSHTGKPAPPPLSARAGAAVLAISIAASNGSVAQQLDATEPLPIARAVQCCLAELCITSEVDDCMEWLSAMERETLASTNPTTVDEVVRKRRTTIDVNHLSLTSWDTSRVRPLLVEECIAVETDRSEAIAARTPATSRFEYCAVRDPCSAGAEVTYVAWMLPPLGGEGSAIQRPPSAGRLFWAYFPGKTILDVSIVSLAEWLEGETCLH